MTDMRRCIGSAKFGIEAHEAPATDFPAQPSQKDGLGRMCKPHWNQYTNALRKAALVRYSSIIVSTIPIMCFYPFVQKYFNQGVMIGAVKG